MPTYYIDGVSGNDGNAGTSFGAAYLTIAKAASVFVAGDTIIICATGTYTLTATTTWTFSATPGALVTIQGANATGTVDGTLPTITTATNSTTLFTIVGGSAGIGNLLISGLKLTNIATTKAAVIVTATTAINMIRLEGCFIDLGATTGAISAVDLSSKGPNELFVAGNTIQKFMGWGVTAGSGGAIGIPMEAFGNTVLGATGCTGGLNLTFNGSVLFALNSIDNCTIGIQQNNAHAVGMEAWLNSFHNCTTGIKFVGTAGSYFRASRNAIYGSTTGISFSAPSQTTAQYQQCHLTGNSFGNCTTNIDDANLPVYDAGPTIGSDPWPNASTGDFRAGSGSAIRAAAWPTTPVGLSLTQGADVGAVQHVDSGGGGSPVKSAYAI